MLTFILLLVCIAATVISDAFGEPPTYLVGLLGTAAGAFFAAIGSDKTKRDVEVRDTANRAEAKAEAVEHRIEAGEDRAVETDRRADASEQRERDWSQHRDHAHDGGDDGGGKG